jgi:hypothetical protein
MTLYCNCETPVMDIEVDAGCRRCGLPVNFAPECEGHPSGPFDPMGETVYCDGSCRALSVTHVEDVTPA